MRRTPPDLGGVDLKLQRAETHIQTLRDQTKTFLEGNPPPFEFRTEKTPRPDKSVDYVSYAIVREKPPRDLAPIIGDVVHNVRSALEHLAYELASNKARRSRSTGFPIFTDECQFKVLGTPRIQSITGNERALIERVQPYNATDPPRNDPLAILHELSNLDKHRLLVPIIMAVSRTGIWVAAGNADIEWTHIEPGPVEHDTKIVAFTAIPKDPTTDMNVQPQFDLQIQLRDSETGALGLDLDLVWMMETLHHYVRSTVIDSWFKWRHLPPTAAEVKARQTTPPPPQAGP